MKKFLSLSKPGIIFGNAVSVVAGYFLGLQGDFDASHFLLTLVGISLVIAGGSAFNNVWDRDIDALMERTKARPMVLSAISIPVALCFATVVSIAGLFVLWHFANTLTMLSAVFGLFIYVVVYSLWLKRNSILGTEAGSLSGSVPPLVGYCAVANTIDLPIVLLFLVLCFWQMPHSHAIVYFRADEFRKAKLPLLPLLKSDRFTKIVMVVYGLAFLATAVFINILGFAGNVYLGIIGVSGGLWVVMLIQGFWISDNQKWARKVFFGSLFVVICLSLGLILDRAFLG